MAPPAPVREAEPPVAPRRVTPDRRARMAEAPKAPWSPFPLVELVILIGLVMFVAGIGWGGSRRGVLIAGGFTLISLASLELSVREHFAGFRSHSALLAGAAAVLVAVVLAFFSKFVTKLPQEALLGAGVVTFAITFRLMRNAFVRRTGGLGFRA